MVDLRLKKVRELQDDQTPCGSLDIFGLFYCLVPYEN
jgi:hypothetical protein